MSLTKPNTLNRLSSIEVANAKPERGKTEKNLNDGGGLYCVVTEIRKRWQYQFSLLGNKGKIWLGEYPKLSLAAARKMRNSAKELVDAGKDPRVEKQTAKIALQYSAANTFETVAREWHAKELASDKWKASHAARIMKRLESDIFPIIGKRTIESLETRDLLYPLNLVLKRGTYNLAQAYRQYITAIMRYAVQTQSYQLKRCLFFQSPSGMMQKQT
nr:integrase arm-type DNA-binding domain-containing protein [uncultured Deefgea sp.]